ncbi:MAG: hypothetical protein H6598_09810 [Flavobacteriales bacterium]|nr:hypothetical protein [Flavobacteriales bacterium]
MSTEKKSTIKPKRKSRNIEWLSKSIDLVIVIVGITIAFQLNNYAEWSASREKEMEYIGNFIEETNSNLSDLQEGHMFVLESASNVDTLIEILVYSTLIDSNKCLQLSMNCLVLPDFHPIQANFNNVAESGEFGMITDPELRNQIVIAYGSYENLINYESLLNDYAHEYIVPYLMKNLDFIKMKTINDEIYSDIEFVNILIGYKALVTQCAMGYKHSIEEAKALMIELNSTIDQ